MSTTRRLAAILAADVAGYSRLMAAEEVGTLAALKACRREVIDPQIATHNGRIVKTTGDGMLVEFASAVDAVTCAVAVQEVMAGRGGGLAFRAHFGRQPYKNKDDVRRIAEGLAKAGLSS
jgi:adenylate cyclase